MTLVERMRTLDWWMWGVSLALLVVGLLGWYTGLYVLVLLSALQVAYFFLARATGWLHSQRRSGPFIY